MNYKSLGGAESSVSFSTALFKGLAGDGSLYVPESIPLLDPAVVRSWVKDKATLASVGGDVLAPYLPEISRRELTRILETQWNWPVPLRALTQDILLIEEFHGPTLAFKDLGARFMAGAMSYLLGRDSRQISILVATSGDTGSAVAHGFHGAPGITVFVLYPSGKVSPLQEQQMATLGGNIRAVELQGTFDDCQRLVKRALGDQEVAAARTFTTANSINLGRLLPQMVFYAWAWSQVCRIDDAAPGKGLRLVIPSGNFGNLTAALYAKRMGVPLGAVLTATNRNRVVPDYLETGLYEPHPSFATYSSAMDVGDPSNWSRIRRLYDEDDAAIRRDLTGASADDKQTLEEIRRSHSETGIVLDPHTAVGVHAARRWVDREPGPVAVAATAHPGKFPEVIRRALGSEPPIPDSLREAMGREKHSVMLANDYGAWKRLLLAGVG